MAVFSPYFLESSAAPRLCQHPYRSHMPPPQCVCTCTSFHQDSAVEHRAPRTRLRREGERGGLGGCGVWEEGGYRQEPRPRGRTGAGPAQLVEGDVPPSPPNPVGLLMGLSPPQFPPFHSQCFSAHHISLSSKFYNSLSTGLEIKSRKATHISLNPTTGGQLSTPSKSLESHRVMTPPPAPRNMTGGELTTLLTGSQSLACLADTLVFCQSQEHR